MANWHHYEGCGELCEEGPADLEHFEVPSHMVARGDSNAPGVPVTAELRQTDELRRGRQRAFPPTAHLDINGGAADMSMDELGVLISELIALWRRGMSREVSPTKMLAG